jgi:hypothetical protein
MSVALSRLNASLVPSYSSIASNTSVGVAIAKVYHSGESRRLALPWPGQRGTKVYLAGPFTQDEFAISLGRV